MSIMGIQWEYSGILPLAFYIIYIYFLHILLLYIQYSCYCSFSRLKILPQRSSGWYIYTEAVRALGGVVSNAGIINTPGWDVYKTTVADGTFWGAYITGDG
jgi:hypothetical protein